jgi:hypothetical protein
MKSGKFSQIIAYPLQNSKKLEDEWQRHISPTIFSNPKLFFH